MRLTLKKMMMTAAAGALLTFSGLVACSSPAQPEQRTAPSEPSAAMAAARTPAAGLPAVIVYKSPSCGCCTKWVEHMQAAGFAVSVADTPDPEPLKKQYGIGTALRSCHTALVEGYAVEGHVPAEDVMRLLKERPKVTGIAVPGMPVGSPGMEVGTRKDPYKVLAFTKDGSTKDGSTSVFANH
jgi:hypothetical protein